MTLAELDEHIKTFKRRVNDPQLSEAQRAAFQAALEGAEKQRQELLVVQAPLALSEPEPANPKTARTAKTDSQVNTPAISVEIDTAITTPELPPQDGGQEKKTVVRSSARIAGILSTPGHDSTQIVVDCDLENVSKAVIIFRWGSTEERLSPGVTMGRFKARVADVAHLGKKKPEQSRCFHRAVAYYTALAQFAGRELTPADFGFRGRKLQVLYTIREAYRNQKR